MEVGHKVRTFVVGALVVGLFGFAPSPATAAPGAGAGGDRSALIIGISRHAGRRPVGTVGGAGDARVVQEALRRAGWRDDQMRVLVDAGATAAAIRDGISWLQNRSNDSSFSIFHYSGHTFQRGGDRDRDGEELDEFLVPYDTRNIMVDREVANRLGAVAGWLWANFAGCEAIGFDEAGLSGPRRLVTASSAEPEKSYERPDWKMSVFVGLMVDQAILKGRGDANGDRAVSIQEALAYAAREAPIMTAKQSKGPQNPQIRGGDGQPWFLG
ncbi:MAG: caspase family protein, partial [Acidimicrobiales bacterium]